jgi:predicted dehydrogenase
MSDPEVGLVIIASRHNSHAELTARTLRSGKAAYVEKPLALTPQELKEVSLAYADSPSPFAMVGFNRRFAPLLIDLREFLSGVKEPLLMNYRVNAGYIPRTHWTQDPEEGGGRIVGEVCHFVDLLLYLARSRPTEVYALGLPDFGRYNSDNISVTIRFANGSVGTITYAANGDQAFEKERLEIFGGGRVAVLDDFRRLHLVSGGQNTLKKSKLDKGHRSEMHALIAAVHQGAPEPVPFAEAVLAMKTTFAIVEVLASGQPTFV